MDALTLDERAAIVRSFRLVLPILDTAADLFYRRLFEIRPDYRALFGSDMNRQKRKIGAMLSFVVRSIDLDNDRSRGLPGVSRDSDLFAILLALGHRHHTLYAVPPEAYAPVGEALLWALEHGLGPEFTPALRLAWAKLYESLASTMRLGALPGVARVSGALGGTR